MAERSHALALYIAAVIILLCGGAMAASRYPGGFDWSYTVVSALASQKHNPDGGVWFAGAFAVAMLLLLPVAGHIDRAGRALGDRPRLSLGALRAGLVLGAVLGLERYFIYHLSDIVHKAHELLALVTFLALYWGVIGLYVHRIRRSRAFLWPAILVVLPLFSVGMSQLALWLDQRDIGWVGVGWREIGIPLWLSFAFWQWLAVGFLLLGLGCLVAIKADPKGSRKRGGAYQGVTVHTTAHGGTGPIIPES